MPDRDYDWIARRAYALWEDNGRPDGEHEAHWRTALDDWERLQDAANQTREKSERRIAQAQVSAEEEGLIITEEPVQPRRKSTRGRKG